MPGSLIVVLGDQLSPRIAALRQADSGRDTVLMVEARTAARRVKRHRMKIVLVLSAMRHFADELRAAGSSVDYVTLDKEDNSGSLIGEIAAAARRHGAERIVVTEPGGWRLREALRTLGAELLEDDRFLCSHGDFAAWADGRRELRMEFFYREMRRKTGLLMEGDAPAGGRWNFDADNRQPPRPGQRFPAPPRFESDRVTQEVTDLVERHFSDHFGALAPFPYAVDRGQAEIALMHFIEHALPGFGDAQDAMLAGEPLMNHSLLSAYLNMGLLDPLDVCRRVEDAWRAGHAPINAAEGFIRQVIGWREYVRGVYWRLMPGYLERNALSARRDLPWFYWSGETDMACIAQVVGQTRDMAYAHHIQRLMITGNFTLLAGIDPAQVHEWYLAVYADAFEWVEAPNTIGMSQFADGGAMASKPYAASGNYISRMSDYCGGCAYSPTVKNGPKACPFNYLYWDFLDRNRAVLGDNHRLLQPYRTWDRMSEQRRRATRDDAARFLRALDDGGTPGAEPIQADLPL